MSQDGSKQSSCVTRTFTVLQSTDEELEDHIATVSQGMHMLVHVHTCTCTIMTFVLNFTYMYVCLCLFCIYRKIKIH